MTKKERFEIKGEPFKGGWRVTFPEPITLRDGDTMEQWMAFPDPDGVPVFIYEITRAEEKEIDK